MTQKGKKRTAGMDSRIQGGKLENLISEILKFRDRRDWAQFHDPKNLAEAIAIESGELLEHFLWKTSEESRKIKLTYPGAYKNLCNPENCELVKVKFV